MTSVRASSAFFLVPCLAPGLNDKSVNMLRFTDKGDYTRGLKLQANKQDTGDNCEDIRFDWKQMATFGSGSFLPYDKVHCQFFPIRLFETEPNGNRTVTLETLMNVLQESGINCVKGVGIEVDGLALSPHMRSCRFMIDNYPISGDFVIVNSWSSVQKTGITRYTNIIDNKTGDRLLLAYSDWVFLIKETGELANFLPDEKICPDKKDEQLPTPTEITTRYVWGDLESRWIDLDDNQPVNNAKYISWIIETVPRPILKKYVPENITMEYKRECCLHMDILVECKFPSVSEDETHIECCQMTHCFKLNDGTEIMKATTDWRLKSQITK